MKTLFRNGSIHTMNGTEVVHSLLVEDGRILDVNCDVPAGECQVVDLHGKTVLPGFHDSHEHFLCYATDKEKINFFGIRSLEEMAERTSRYIADRGIKRANGSRAAVGTKMSSTCLCCPPGRIWTSSARTTPPSLPVPAAAWPWPTPPR